MQTTPQAANVARTMQDYVHHLDPTRPTTYAAPQGDTFEGINGVIQVRGWNYHPGPEMDSYHAEHPGPTDPNRQFATSGSTCGMVDNTNQAYGWQLNVTGTTCAKSIFEALSDKNITWKNYYETDIIDAWMYEWVQENAKDQLVHSSEFYSDLANGTLPQFSYYNPECCTMDSFHPTSNMAAGELMLKHFYDSIRQSQYWDNM